MDYDKKLEMLAKEIESTMAHVEQVLNEYIKTVIVQEMVEMFNEADDIEKKMFILSILKEISPTAFHDCMGKTILDILTADVKDSQKEVESETFRIKSYIVG